MCRENIAGHASKGGLLELIRGSRSGHPREDDAIRVGGTGFAWRGFVLQVTVVSTADSGAGSLSTKPSFPPSRLTVMVAAGLNLERRISSAIGSSR